MTREEAILVLDSLSTWLGYEKPITEEIVEAIKILSNSSLPSDLDEAAGKYANREYPNEPSCGQWGTGDYEPPVDMEYPREIAKDSFKAGAEWMAGQGWISVDEKLPEMDEEVIVLTDEFGTAPIYKIAFGHIVDVKRCIDYNGWNCPGVKFWMPCPKIPNND